MERFATRVGVRRITAPSWRRLVAIAMATVAVALAASTAVVAALESAFALPDASGVYLIAVIAVASRLGTWSAVATSIGAFLAYDFLFVQPVYTFQISAPGEWLNLLLFLLIAIVVGRRTALLAEREREATQRAREARVLFSISLDLSGAPTLEQAITRVVQRLTVDSRMSRIWCTLGDVGAERVVADTSPGERRPLRTTRNVLQRDAAGTPTNWIRLHDPPAGRRGAGGAGATDVAPVAGALMDAVRASSDTADMVPIDVFSVPITAGGSTLGALRATRPLGLDPPTAESTRFLAAAADQIGQAVQRDRLAAESTNAEISRRSDRLKSALLDSVSHDLRTPLAAIRALAGNLMDRQVATTPDEVAVAAASIEGEAARMNRLVANLLDLSRIEGGAIQPDLAPYEVGDLVDPVVERMTPAFGDAALVRDIPDDLPPVLVDAVWVDQVLTNLIENALEHCGRHDAVVRIRAGAVADDRLVELTVEDNGRGVPAAERPHLFEKFRRVRRPNAPSSRGLGIGLTVVRGLIEATGGSVEARSSELGGLAVVLRLPTAAEPPAEQAP